MIFFQEEYHLIVKIDDLQGSLFNLRAENSWFIADNMQTYLVFKIATCMAKDLR